MSAIDQAHTARWKAGSQVCSHLTPTANMWPANIETYSISLRRGGVQIFISGLGCDTL